MRTIEQVMSHLEPVTESGCLIWSKCIQFGYGIVTFNGKQQKVHRVMYEHFVGKVPEGLVLDHLCRVRCCANTHHLEVVTVRENILRGIGSAANHFKKTHCLHGHPFSGENLYLRPDKTRICRICNTRNDRTSKSMKRLKRLLDHS